MDKGSKEWISVKDAAEHIGMDYKAFRDLVKKGAVPAHLAPGAKRFRIYRKELDEWLLAR